MNHEVTRLNEIKALTRPIRKFSDLENSIKWLLNKEVIPNEASYMLQSFSAHLYTKHIVTEEDTVCDVLKHYMETVKDNTSTWFDLSKTHYIDKINLRIDDLLLQHIYRKETV